MAHDGKKDKRGGPGRGQGRHRKLKLAQELWVEARAEELRRAAWINRQDPAATPPANSGEELIQRMAYANIKPTMRGSVYKKIVREVLARYGKEISDDTVKRILKDGRGDV